MKQLLLCFLIMLLFSATTFAQKNKVESKRVESVSTDSERTVITYKDASTTVIYNDAIGRSVQKILERHAKSSLSDTLISALSIGIYLNGVSFTEHYGELSVGVGNKPTDKTIWEVASITKTFTGTLAAMAVLEGKLTLQDDIRKYLPDPYFNLEYMGKPIKVKHLLTHTSGLPANNKEFDAIPQGLTEEEQSKLFYEIERRQTKAQFFKELSETVIDTLPGSTFRYSNFGTNLMGYILERVYETPFQELIEDKVIGDLASMNTAKFHLTEEEENYLSIGYNGSGAIMPSLPLANTLWGAEGGLKATMPAMIKYMKCQLNSKEEVVTEAHRRLYEIDTDYWIGYFWWIIQNQKQDLHFRHDGGALGTRNVLLLYPDANVGISVITNRAANGVFENLSRLAKGIYNDIVSEIPP